MHRGENAPVDSGCLFSGPITKGKRVNALHEVNLSVGIDIGTSTTQLIFSRLTIENRASSYTVPRIQIVDKEVTLRNRSSFGFFDMDK